MTITIAIRYKGQVGAARAFAAEMTNSGLVQQIRNQEGNLAYDYFQPLEDPDSLLLLDKWASQEALDRHHRSDFMGQIMALRDKYGLSMTAERYQDASDQVPDRDKAFISQDKTEQPLTLYHNPNCSKSQAVLTYLLDQGYEPDIIQYLDNPLSRQDLLDLLAKLGQPASAICRLPEEELEKLTEPEILDRLVAQPDLLNRPILVTPKGARLCRPPEVVLDLL